MNSKKEKLQKQVVQFEKAIYRLTDILQKPKDEYFRDSAIQRFEFNFEICWKLLKNILEFKGIVANSPRDVFKGAFQVSLVEQETLWLQMIEDRNFTTHVYGEELIEEVYSRLGGYLKLYQELLDKVRETIKSFEDDDKKSSGSLL